MNPITVRRHGDPRVTGTAVAFTEHRYNQDEVSAQLTSFAEPGFARFAASSGVEYRSLALPLERYSGADRFHRGQRGVPRGGRGAR